MKLRRGDSVSHYELVEELGAGGMGVVYLARDTRLDRRVALKFLPAGTDVGTPESERFIEEAKLTSALDHPNICTIHDIDLTPQGQTFIVMSYYEGETLRQRVEKGALSVREATDLTVQLCEGLDKAHRSGIVHRDIKPDNLILTSDGILKIVDFGIAKLLGHQGRTQPGAVVGTPAYMAPEQIKGEDVDVRADIWATGVTLFYMLCAQLPFRGDSDLGLMYSIVHEPPLSVRDLRGGVPEQLEAVVLRALAKEAAQRYPSVGEMLRDLKGDQTAATMPAVREPVAEAAAPTLSSLAVMTFKDLSPARDQASLCEGLSEAIISDLGRLRGLRVISPASAFRVSAQDVTLGTIGARLDVQAVLEGSIQRSGNRLRILIRLVKVQSGEILWTHDFRAELDDIFEIQDQISRQVAEALEIQLGRTTPPPVVAKPRTSEVAAYSAYLRGRYFWNRRSVDAIKRGIQSFTEAIDLDSKFAPALAGLADSYAILGIYGAYPPSEVMVRARDTALRALEVNDAVAEAHVSLGCVESVFEWNWRGGEGRFRRAIELNSNYAAAHHRYAVDNLIPQGRTEEAVEQLLFALDLDPVSPAISTSVGLPYYFSGDFDAAISHFHNALEIEDGFALAHAFLGEAYVQGGRFDQGMEHLETAVKLYSESTNMLALYGCGAAVSGQPEAARDVLRKLRDIGQTRYVSAYDLAGLEAALGNLNGAIEALKGAVQERSYLLIYLARDPIFAELRKHPEVLALLSQVEGRHDHVA
jgi:TolB-like protein/predicted Ser/Thr protein kinase